MTDPVRAGVGLAIVVSCAAMLTCARSADAGDDSARALDLAKICVHEAGWESPDDCAAIHAVLRSRMDRRGYTWRQAARWYSTRVFDLTRADRRRWVPWLRADGRRPRGWPAGLAWEPYRQRWARVQRWAHEVIDGVRTASCEPHHWGAPNGGDLARAIAWGWVRVDCGATRNAYWRTDGK